MRRTIVHTCKLASVLIVLGFVSCSKGGSSGGAAAPAGPVQCDGHPVLLELSPSAGCVGDGILLSGVSIPLDPDRITVRFVDVSGAVAIEAPIVSTVDDGPHPVLICDGTTILVEVPGGALTGTVEVWVRGDDDELVSAGELPFEACPQIVSFGANANADPWLVASLTSALLTSEFQIFGYNLQNVTEVSIVDSTGSSAPGATVAPGLGSLVAPAYTLPDGLEVVTVNISGMTSAPLTCVSTYFRFSLLSAGSGVALESNSVIVPVRVIYSPGVVEDLPGTITGSIVPTGVRRGVLDLHFVLTMAPAMARYDVRPQYWDPDLGEWIDCAGVDPDEGEQLIPGVPGQESLIAPIVAGGATHVFRWDTVANGIGYDAAGPVARFTTRVRYLVENIDTTLIGICEPYALYETRYETPPIIIDNPLNPDGSLSIGDGAIVEGFDSIHFDPTYPATALWNDDDSGVLTDGAVPPDVPWGSGANDVVCSAISSASGLPGVYVFNTDTAAITDASDPASTVPLHQPAAGDPTGVMRLRTLTIEAGALIEVVGSQPLRVHLSGTGNPSDVVCSIQSDLHLDGTDGEEGSPNTPGAGGTGGPGGGAGGVGGDVLLTASISTAGGDTLAGDGEANGGRGGSNITYARVSSPSVPKAGPGGGGGARSSGEAGSTSFSSSFILGPPGDGGPRRSDAALIFDLVGGSGGGGGGATVIRQTATDNLRSDAGGGGGGGGGAVEFIANGTVLIGAVLSASGGNGGQAATVHAGPGGGGSGGGIAVRATGDITVTSAGAVTATGGLGASTGLQHGGDGSDGWVRFESDGTVHVPATVDGQLLTGGATATTGIAVTGAIDGGSGIDGPLDFSFHPDGLYVVDTNAGEIRGPVVPPVEFTPDALLAAAAVAPIIATRSDLVAWNFSALIVRSGVQLRGVGSQPLIFRVDGPCIIEGNGLEASIDVSGFDGALPDVSNPSEPLGGPGGSGGPSGGPGGNGGESIATGTQNGADAPLDFLPADYVAGSFGDLLPLPPIFGARGGNSIGDASSVSPAGSGGGGGHGWFGEDGFGPLSGDGGDRYGSLFFTNPLTGGPFPFGGAGGGGGGGHANADALEPFDRAAGTGGGGGGGYFELSVHGNLFIDENAVVLARGGDAFSAPVFAGNGGAGAGGAIYIRCDGSLVIDGLLDARAGGANQDPPGTPYTSNGNDFGGAGGPGRIRLESTAGFLPPLDLFDFVIGDVYREATQFRTRARSKPYPVLTTGGARANTPEIHDVSVLLETLGPPPAGSTLVIQYEGAPESKTRPGRPGTFSGLVSELSQLDDTAFVRITWNIYSDSSAGETFQLDSTSVLFGL